MTKGSPSLECDAISRMILLKDKNRRRRKNRGSCCWFWEFKRINDLKRERETEEGWRLSSFICCRIASNIVFLVLWKLYRKGTFDKRREGKCLMDNVWLWWWILWVDRREVEMREESIARKFDEIERNVNFSGRKGSILWRRRGF